MATYTYNRPFLYADNDGNIFPSVNVGYGPWTGITKADLTSKMKDEL